MKFGLSALLLMLVLPATAQRKFDKSIGGPLVYKTVKVVGGYFDLGDDDESSDRKPAHSVKLTDYYMGAYEVRQDMWETIMGENPSYFQCAACPVTNVSWNEVQDFIKRLNEATGKKYRLPTEAEWEYAARGGNFEHLVKAPHYRGGVNEFLVADSKKGLTTREKTKEGNRYAGRNGGPQSVAWYEKDSRDRIHPVGFKQPNELGLYDMSGNVEEWCSDWYEGSYGSKDTVDNPTGPIAGRSHVVRGGAFNSDAHDLLVTRRAAYLPDTRAMSLGFRLVEDKE